MQADTKITLIEPKTKEEKEIIILAIDGTGINEIPRTKLAQMLTACVAVDSCMEFADTDYRITGNLDFQKCFKSYLETAGMKVFNFINPRKLTKEAICVYYLEGKGKTLQQIADALGFDTKRTIQTITSKEGRTTALKLEDDETFDEVWEEIYQNQFNDDIIAAMVAVIKVTPKVPRASYIS